MTPARIIVAAVVALLCAQAQEGSVGLAVPATLSGNLSLSERGQSTAAAAYRAVFYPQLKLGANWFGYAAIQVYRAPYFQEQLASPDRSTHVHVLQAYVGYSRVAASRALTLKVGQLTSAFGQFPLRYDDARNPLIDMPLNYGYYYAPTTVYGLPGAELNAVAGKTDLRIQFTNSAPNNPRRLWQSDQYGVWTAGGGYSIRQGLRLGASAYRGPYLHRQNLYFFPGEARPKDLDSTALGLDVQAARGRWTLSGEAQRFKFAYRAIPYFFNSSVYGEARFTLTPRWYIAGRAAGRWRTAYLGSDQAYDVVLGFRPAPGQLLKFGYTAVNGRIWRGPRDNVAAVQYVFTFAPPAWVLR